MWDFDGSSDTIDGCDANIYDTGFAYPMEYETTDDLWSDPDEAANLIAEIEEDGCDRDCIKNGCRWSVVYSLCGVTLILIAVNSALNFIGTWMYAFRALSNCCGLLLCLVNFSAIIVTAVFRFNTLGKLAALSNNPTKYDDNGKWTFNDLGVIKTAPLSDDRNYTDDASFIIAMWVCQMVFCCCNCCLMGYTSKPPDTNITVS